MQKLCDTVLCSDDFFNLSYGSGQLCKIMNMVFLVNKYYGNGGILRSLKTFLKCAARLLTRRFANQEAQEGILCVLVAQRAAKVLKFKCSCWVVCARTFILILAHDTQQLQFCRTFNFDCWQFCSLLIYKDSYNLFWKSSYILTVRFPSQELCSTFKVYFSS